jgi:hypothetical protein
MRCEARVLVWRVVRVPVAANENLASTVARPFSAPCPSSDKAALRVDDLRPVRPREDVTEAPGANFLFC